MSNEMKGKFWVVSVLAGLFLMQGCQTRKEKAGNLSPRIEITPKQALVDAKVSVRVVGLQSNEQVTLRATFTDDMDLRWESHVEFVANTNGVVDPGFEAPISGTYTGIDPAGLFWSMSPIPGQNRQPAFKSNSLLPTTITFTADVVGKQVASSDFERLYEAPSVVREPIHEDGLAGVLFLPAKAGRYPGVITLSGSGGGLHERAAALLASNGLAVLALAYFNYDGLPKDLVDIPLEYFGRAIRFMQTQGQIEPGELAVLGASRGGELALLLGSKFPQLKAVVAYVPSSVLWSGDTDDPHVPPPASWTYHGKPLPFMVENDWVRPEPATAANGAQQPISYRSAFEKALANTASVKNATIDVEKISGPVLLISGDDDQIWPSSPMSDMVMKRLAEYDHPYPDKHLAYHGAGHDFMVPNLPATMLSMVYEVTHQEIAFGGDAKDNAAAASDSWPRVIAFLHESLNESAAK